MLVSRRQLVEQEPRTLNPHRWRNVAALTGFISALTVAAWQVYAADSQAFLFLLLGCSALSWLVLDHPEQSLPLLYTQTYARFAAPWLSSLLTLCAAALLRDYYSGSALLSFALVWSFWLLLGQLWWPRSAYRLRALLVGESVFHERLQERGELLTTQLDHVPDDFNRWDVIVIDPRQPAGEEWTHYLAHAELAGKVVMSAPTLLELLTGRVSTEVLQSRWAPLIFHGTSRYAFWKRAFDLSTTVVLAPVLLLVGGFVALAVRLCDGPQVLFRQERVGKNGATFQMVKFRSMRRDAEANGALFATLGDARVTRLGGFLRQYRLDELPQFWNVLCGDMSIIGPRPEQRTFVEQFAREIPLYSIRHHVRPGITGWAQVTQGYAAGADETREKLRCDFFYIKHFSLRLDLRIVGQTLRTISSGFGAR